MPTRIVRDSLLSSERYWSVTIEARLLYIHILLLADDFGCLSLAPFHLKKMCFESPPSDPRLTRILAELVDEDLIRRYEFNGAVYGFVPRFRQRLQRMTLKHPMPPQSIYQDDSDALEKFNRIRMNVRNPTVGQPFPNRSPTDEVEVKGIEKKRSEGANLASALVDQVASSLKGRRSEEKKAGINPEVQGQVPDQDDPLTLKAAAAGLEQRPGEGRGQFALRVAQAQPKGKFDD